MVTHVKVLAWLYIICGVLGTLFGLGLMAEPWARIVTIVLSAFNLMNIPFATILGIYGLWVMLADDGSRLFATASAPPVA